VAGGVEPEGARAIRDRPGQLFDEIFEGVFDVMVGGVLDVIFRRHA
jgi:hypothetical protein